MSAPVPGTIYCGDCLEVMREWPGGCVDMICTDPPYLINSKSDGQGKLSPWADICNAAYWFAAWVGECRRVLRNNGCLWVFTNWRTLSTMQKVSCDLAWPIELCLVWHKNWIGPGGSVGLRPSYELVLLWPKPEFSIANRGLPDLQTFPWSGHKPSGHPAEKPESLCRWLITQSFPAPCLVLDPFAGSGTTLAAAERANYPYIGIELDPHWCAKARARTAQRGIFTEVSA